jgi:hypothetical protein
MANVHQKNHLPVCPWLLKDLFKRVTDLALFNRQPGFEDDASAMFRWLVQSVHEIAGGRASDIRLAAIFLTKGDELDERAADPNSDLGPYSGRPDLCHVVKALHELDRDGTTDRLWRQLCRKWPIFAKAAHDVMAPGTTGKKRSSMTVPEANAQANKLAKEIGERFFAMSMRRQAKLIGCHLRTWKRTDLYKSALKRGLITPPKQRAPKAVSFSGKLEAVTGEGDKDETLHQLIEQQLADSEPSPMVDDAPGRERKVRSHKRP